MVERTTGKCDLFWLRPINPLSFLAFQLTRIDPQFGYGATRVLDSHFVASVG